MGYLKAPAEGTDCNTEAGFLSLIPDDDDFDEWQEYARETMIEQWRNNQPYYWPRKRLSVPYSGCIWNHDFRGKRILHGAEVNGVYCCGLSFEHFLLCHKSFMDTLYETRYDLTWNEMYELYKFFFVWDSRGKYDKGSGLGVERAGEWMKAHFEAAQKEGVEHEEDNFEDFVGARYHYHTDPNNARFGAYVQIQNGRDIHGPSGGHAAIFLGLEEREGAPVVRVFQANFSGDYGMNPGVNCGWYKIDKPDKNDPDFTRIFHFGEVIADN